MARQSAGAACAIDLYVGMRLKLRRTSLGLTVSELALAFAVPQKTVTAWEAGEARISASELYELSQILEVPQSFFYAGLVPGSLSPGRASTQSLQDHVQSVVEIIQDDDNRTLLLTYFDQLPRQHQAHVLDIARTLANATGAESAATSSGRRSPKSGCN
jgi:transcriptional regulator with XRE-family HTH domain